MFNEEIRVENLLRRETLGGGVDVGEGDGVVCRQRKSPLNLRLLLTFNLLMILTQKIKIKIKIY
jgi:hypothetical protein